MIGWLSMNIRVKWFVLVLMTMLIASPSTAKDAQTLSKQDLEFLEFLGSWETEDGEWVNPLDLIEKPMDEQAGEEVLYDPKAKGEADDVPGQPGHEDIRTPFSPVSGVETDE